MFYSIGYERITIKGLLRIIRQKKIDRIIDVRSAPYARHPDKYEFNRNQMRVMLGEWYLWKGDILGGKYGPASEEGILWLIELPPWPGFLLMCVEYDPRKCHRYYDISKRLLHAGIDVIHLYGPEEILTSKLIQEGINVR